MIKKITSTTVRYALMILLGFIAGSILNAAQTVNQTILFTAQNNSSGLCPGTWTGYANMTNATDGAIWIVPPTNAISGTLSDGSGFPPPYVSVAYVKRKSDFKTWCDTNTVNFPVTNTTKYQLTIYVKSALPPPTNGQPMNLQVTWQTP